MTRGSVMAILWQMVTREARRQRSRDAARMGYALIDDPALRRRPVPTACGHAERAAARWARGGDEHRRSSESSRPVHLRYDDLRPEPPAELIAVIWAPRPCDSATALLCRPRQAPAFRRARSAHADRGSASKTTQRCSLRRTGSATGQASPRACPGDRAAGCLCRCCHLRPVVALDGDPVNDR